MSAKTETKKKEKKPGTSVSPRARVRFSETVTQIILGRMAEGETLRQVCRDPAMPSRGTVYRWLGENPQFRGQYRHARELLVEHWADEMVDISDDATTDYITKTGRNGHEYEAVDQEHIQRSRLRVDTRKWLMSKLNPGEYGDKIEHDVTGQVDHVHRTDISDRERMRRMALFLMEDQQAGQLIEGEVVPDNLQASPAKPLPSEPESDDT